VKPSRLLSENDDMKNRLYQGLAAFALFSQAAVMPAIAESAAPVNLRILAINDFHGYLKPPSGGIRITDPDDSGEQARPQHSDRLQRRHLGGA
jgi:2',3'-cyclic-nucleotide 2'-phosphodiesterase (5'-nucleotidase family)